MWLRNRMEWRIRWSGVGLNREMEKGSGTQGRSRVKWGGGADVRNGMGTKKNREWTEMQGLGLSVNVLNMLLGI